MTYRRHRNKAANRFQVRTEPRVRAVALFALTGAMLIVVASALFFGASRADAGVPVGMVTAPQPAQRTGVGSAAASEVHSPSDDPSADLTPLKAGPNYADPDTDIVYTITVSNNGPDAAVLASWSDTIPDGLTFVSMSQISGPAFTCSAPNPGDGGTIECSIETFDNGASAVFTTTVHIPTSAAPGEAYTNIVTVSSQTFDPNDENQSSVVVTYINSPHADLSIIKDGPFAAAPGTNISYSIAITNAGPDDAANVVWTDTLPDTMTFVNITQHDGPYFACTTPAVGSGGTITCTLATVLAGAGAHFTLVGYIPSDTESGTQFTNTASVTSDTPDPNDENQSSSVTTTVASADMSVVKSGPATGTAGQNVMYTVFLANNGPDFATDAAFSDALPKGFTFVSITQNTGPTANCSAPPVGSNGTVICTISVLPPDQSATFTLVVRSSPSALGPVDNTAKASTSAADINNNNDSSTTTATFSASSDLTVSKTGAVTVTAGSNIAYSVTLTNTGPSNAQSVTLNDTLPAGTKFVSATQTSGPAFNCTPGSTSISCSAATLAADASAGFGLVLSADRALHNGDLITNTAQVGSTTADPSSANNSAVVTSTVASVADLGIVKTHSGTIQLGQPVTYVITVTNSGPSVAYGAVVTDTFQSGLTGVTYQCSAVSGAYSKCYSASGVGNINATVDVDVNGQVVFTATALVTDPTSTTLDNTAYVSLPSANGTDPNLSNNSWTDTGNVAPTDTPTSTSTATSSATATASATSTQSAVETSTATSTAMPTTCTTFVDEPPSATFYQYVQCLACRGIVTGYPDGTYREGNPITRGQIAKIVSNAAGFFEDPGSQIYSDVPPGSPFYAYINRLTNRGIVSGYPCPTKPGQAAPGAEPCTPENPQLFRPNYNATRGQMAKIVSNAAGYNEDVSGQYYADVPPTGEGSQFYTWIMRLTNRGVMQGYECGTSDPRSGPCDSSHRPYFRPGNEVTRGQAAKIVANTFFPNCQTTSKP